MCRSVSIMLNAFNRLIAADGEAVPKQTVEGNTTPRSHQFVILLATRTALLSASKSNWPAMSMRKECT